MFKLVNNYSVITEDYNSIKYKGNVRLTKEIDGFKAGAVVDEFYIDYRDSSYYIIYKNKKFSGSFTLNFREEKYEYVQPN